MLGSLSLVPALGCIGLLIALSLWRFRHTLEPGAWGRLVSKATVRGVLTLAAAIILLTPVFLTPKWTKVPGVWLQKHHPDRRMKR